MFALSLILLPIPSPSFPFQGFNNITPLHYAAENGHANVAEVLVKAGADVEAKVCGGSYLLDMCVCISETCKMCAGSASVMFCHYLWSGL